MVQLEEHSLMLDETTDVEEVEGGVRILLIGDPGVGKTSLIYSLTHDEINEKLPARLPDVAIPAKITPEHVPITIADYSQQDPTQDPLSAAIDKATVICILYTSGNHESLDRVAKHWIPTVRGVREPRSAHKPMILVANKIDLNENACLSDKLNAIRQKFIDVEGFIEVSALNQKNIAELFSSTRKAITYPLAPLFEPRARQLTSKCQIALREIFKQIDLDGDGLINDNELNLFQERCFGTPLQPGAVEDLIQVIKQSTIDGVINDSLTNEGFLFLHALSIDKGRQDFTWQVLRKFNYDNQLNLKPNDSEELKQSSSSETNGNSIQSLIDDTEKYLHFTHKPIIKKRELISPMDMPLWVRDNPRTITAGLGLTVTTFISFIALKYLVKGFSRG